MVNAFKFKWVKSCNKNIVDIYSSEYVKTRTKFMTYEEEWKTYIALIEYNKFIVLIVKIKPTFIIGLVIISMKRNQKEIYI